MRKEVIGPSGSPLLMFFINMPMFLKLLFLKSKKVRDGIIRGILINNAKQDYISQDIKDFFLSLSSEGYFSLEQNPIVPQIVTNNGVDFDYFNKITFSNLDINNGETKNDRIDQQFLDEFNHFLSGYNLINSPEAIEMFVAIAAMETAYFRDYIEYYPDGYDPGYPKSVSGAGLVHLTGHEAHMDFLDYMKWTEAQINADRRTTAEIIAQKYFFESAFWWWNEQGYGGHRDNNGKERTRTEYIDDQLNVGADAEGLFIFTKLKLNGFDVYTSGTSQPRGSGGSTSDAQDQLIISGDFEYIDENGNKHPDNHIFDDYDVIGLRFPNSSENDIYLKNGSKYGERIRIYRELNN